MTHHILVVDNDPLQCRSAQLILEKALYKVSTLTGGQAAIDLLCSEKGNGVDLVLLDLSMPEVSGMDVLKAIIAQRPNLPVVMYTAHGDIEIAVEALREGATDFVEKKDGPERLCVCIEHVLRLKKLEGEVSRLKRSREGQVQFSDIIGESGVMAETKRLAERAAGSAIPVLLKGASGVGKELFARAIHGASERQGQAFIAVNCGAIPDNLVESVLFGHEKGAFTGAVEKTIGKFREADGGTLFLDEIGELRSDMQVKLLRALQEGEVEPVGATRPVKVDVRLISATNRNLKQEVETGNFREDLYYRLNVFPVTVPPLKERGKDIGALLDHFAESIAVSENKHIHGLSDQAKSLLVRYGWPGNVRQLENAVYRAVVLCEGDYLDVNDFSHIIGAMERKEDVPHGEKEAVSHTPAAGLDALHLRLLNPRKEFKSLQDIEAEVIAEALEFYDWHITKVSRHLNIGRSTLYRKMAEYGLKDEQDGADAAALSSSL